MYRKLMDYLRLARTYVRFNFRTQLEYRGAFFSQIAGMFINDGAWVIFWMLFFRRFPVLHGWSLTDVLSLWAIVTAGFGLAHGIMGNALHLAGAIVQGELDMWLLQPRAVLPHLLLGRSVPTAWGDALFGFAVYFGFVRPGWERALAFVFLSLVVAVVFVGFGVLTGSMSFFIGNAGALADQWRMSMVMFSTYPPTLFRGAVKILLYTVIPTGFASYLPVETLRSMSVENAVFCVLGAGVILAVGVSAFYLGLRRYESGNLLVLNG